MPLVVPILASLLLAGLLGWWLLRRRRGGAATTQGHSGPDEALDTLAAWPPEAARVMTTAEQRAYGLLARALPANCIVLAQVPLARFLRVPTRHSYREWMRRVGRLNAHLLVCDSEAQVLAVVNVRPAPGTESARARERHERIDKVLRKAGIRVSTWTEDAVPPLDRVREMVLGPARAVAAAPAGDAEPTPEPAGTRPAEPLPSTFFDDLDSAPAPLAHPPRNQGSDPAGPLQGV